VNKANNNMNIYMISPSLSLANLWGGVVNRLRPWRSECSSYQARVLAGTTPPCEQAKWNPPCYIQRLDSGGVG